MEIVTEIPDDLKPLLFDGQLFYGKWGELFFVSKNRLSYADMSSTSAVTAVNDNIYGRYFLQDIEPAWQRDSIMRNLYRYAKPWATDLSGLDTQQLITELLNLFQRDELRVWRLTNGWATPPESGGNGPYIAAGSTAVAGGSVGAAPATTGNASKPKGGSSAAAQPVAATAAVHEAEPAFKPYVGDKIFKKKHPDGTPTDAYTLMPDGLPQGAKEGIVPKQAKGLEDFPIELEPFLNEGFPDVVGRDDFKNFSDIEPKVLPPGSKIYRIVDEGTSEAKGVSGCYWAHELPPGKTAWRSDYAVKDSWNDNGYYVEHTVGDDGLKVWEGKTAGQEYEVHNEKEFYLEGGETQLYVGYGEIPDLKPKLTNWADA